MLKRKLKMIAVLVLAAVLTLTSNGVLQAADTTTKAKDIQSLDAGKEYSYDLDEDGSSETISYEFKNNDYIIYINGTVAKTIELSDEYYGPCLQIADLDTSKKGLDLWAYCYGCSDDILYSALFQYDSTTLKEVYELKSKKIGKNFGVRPGFITKTNGKGKFYVAMDRAVSVEALVGNYFVNIPYQIKNNKVSRIKTKSYQFAALYSSNEKIKAGKFKAARKLKFYTKPNTKSSVAFTLKKGKMVTAKKIYYKNDQCYVQFKNSNGKTGYLKNTNNYEKLPFTNIVLAD